MKGGDPVPEGPESNEHRAVSISASMFAAMLVNIHQRAGQLQYPHLLCCGNRWRQQHSQLLGQTTWIAVHFKGTGLSL
ncbi:hypothetical protein Y1Q_0006589 [Alligator mississippiensis]|uniref:Uncharacterized protein n=1 Tax=Alligator mississippiensis TaxID=8496 RepID=A0A151NT80_ALLMI|nr:hypothetical protein Y1Q_0006589 [Alligator mississippiensis]